MLNKISCFKNIPMLNKIPKYTMLNITLTKEQVAPVPDCLGISGFNELRV